MQRNSKIAVRTITKRLTKSSEPIKLNLGCGDNKIPGFINIDGFAGCNPDVVHDIMTTPLPLPDACVDEVVLFHVIEHIQEKLHDSVLNEIRRVLKHNARFLISYPEFLKCVDCYKKNHRGQRDFFKATIYGRQSHPGDSHVALMDSKFFKTKLIRLGFEVDSILSESNAEFYNTVVSCRKGIPWIEREELLNAEIFKR